MEGLDCSIAVKFPERQPLSAKVEEKNLYGPKIVESKLNSIVPMIKKYNRNFRNYQSDFKYFTISRIFNISFKKNVSFKSLLLTQKKPLHSAAIFVIFGLLKNILHQVVTLLF